VSECLGHANGYFLLRVFRTRKDCSSLRGCGTSLPYLTSYMGAFSVLRFVLFIIPIAKLWFYANVGIIKFSR